MDLTGNTLYVAGTFNLNKKTNLAAIDVTAGTVLPWAPNSNGNVTRIRVTSTTAYVVGDFANGVGGAIRNHRIAAIDLTTAKATAWNPSFNSDVNDIALSATDLYVGGYFDAIDTATYYGGLASFSLSTGNTTLWRPDVRGNSDSQPDIQSLATSNNRLHAGGSFDYVHDYADEARTNYVEYDLCPNAFNLTINGSVLTAPAADSYQWFINNIPIDGATSQTFQINQGEYGAYHVELLLHSCAGRSNDYVNLVTAQESADPHSIKIYPNPFQEEFFIDVPESSTLTLLNVMGQVVKTSALEAAQTNRVETHGLNRGTYILVVRSGAKTNYLRIIKTY